MRISSLTLEYLVTTVTAPVDPTADVVEFAFVAPFTEPGALDWSAGQWVAGTTYDARILVGPGGTVTLTEGDYNAWIRITDSPEIPVRCFDSLTVL